METILNTLMNADHTLTLIKEETGNSNHTSKYSVIPI